MARKVSKKQAIDLEHKRQIRRENAVRTRFRRWEKRTFRSRRAIRAWVLPLVIVGVVTAVVALQIHRKPWPWHVTLRHMLAAPNCDFARLADLAPARRGQPGYYGRHDADQDGIACEPWPR